MVISSSIGHSFSRVVVLTRKVSPSTFFNATETSSACSNVLTSSCLILRQRVLICVHSATTTAPSFGCVRPAKIAGTRAELNRAMGGLSISGPGVKKGSQRGNQLRRSVLGEMCIRIMRVCMSIIGWVVLGLIAGFIASKIVNHSGQGIVMDIVLGVVGAIVGGYLFTLVGQAPVDGVNLYSMFVAVIGAIVVLLVYHAITGRSRPL
jgi:uncharacterized membrane protein YeaQ/YmgE (transglycosylase-associated protein family)